jgi:hypothetical protein
MDAIKEQFKNPLRVGAAALLVGLVLGLLYGWYVDPIEWTDQPVNALRADLQEEYLRMAIDSYALNPDPALAMKRFADLGDGRQAVLDQIMSNPGGQNAQIILAYQATVSGGAGPVLSLTPGVEQPAVTPAEPAEEDKPGGLNLWGIILPILCLGLLAVIAAAFYFLYWKPRSLGKSGMSPAQVAQQAASQAEWTDYSAVGEEPPMVQFMSSYKIGDDLFDESFSIDSPAGEFLGECGVGISETIGVGDPKKVSAFEVWVFDKNDIQTVTKVLMSAHAFLDDASRQRLTAKGEPVLAESGTETVLETQTLRLVARVVDMGYGEGALPDSSFFDRLILELAVWSKA